MAALNAPEAVGVDDGRFVRIAITSGVGQYKQMYRSADTWSMFYFMKRQFLESKYPIVFLVLFPSFVCRVAVVQKRLSKKKEAYWLIFIWKSIENGVVNFICVTT